MFNCITLYKQRGRALRWSGPNSEETPETSGCSWDVLQSTSGCQRHAGVRDNGKMTYICCLQKKRKKLDQCYIHDAGSDVVIVRCSEVTHGVRWVCQIGMKREMHGLWIRHDGGRLLFLPPPQACCLRVQVPLCGIQQTMG